MKRAGLAAAMFVVTACGGRAPEPKEPSGAGGVAQPEAGGGASASPAPAGAPRPVLIGEMCPDRGGGRAAIAVLAARQVGWTSDPEVLDGIVRRGGQRAWNVLGWNGDRAGVFNALGAVDLGTALPAVTGGYAGRAPCDDGKGGEIAACTAAVAGCAPAVASLGADGADDAPTVERAAACAADGVLWFDVDADGQREAFAARGFMDELKAPAEEVTAKSGAGEAPASCVEGFALTGLVTGKDPKAFRGMDLLAVADLDQDGRREVILQYRYGTVTTWAMYAARQGAGRLELVTEVVPWADGS